MGYRENDVRRIVKMVRGAERSLLRPLPASARWRPASPVVNPVLLTGAVVTDGGSGVHYYPAKVMVYDDGAGTWSVLHDCYMIDPNDGTFVAKDYYLARLVDSPYLGLPVYAEDAGSPVVNSVTGIRRLQFDHNKYLVQDLGGGHAEVLLRLSGAVLPAVTKVCPTWVPVNVGLAAPIPGLTHISVERRTLFNLGAIPGTSCADNPACSTGGVVDCGCCEPGSHCPNAICFTILNAGVTAPCLDGLTVVLPWNAGTGDYRATFSLSRAGCTNTPTTLQVVIVCSGGQFTGSVTLTCTTGTDTWAIPLTVMLCSPFSCFGSATGPATSGVDCSGAGGSAGGFDFQITDCSTGTGGGTPTSPCVCCPGGCPNTIYLTISGASVTCPCLDGLVLAIPWNAGLAGYTGSWPLNDPDCTNGPTTLSVAILCQSDGHWQGVLNLLCASGAGNQEWDLNDINANLVCSPFADTGHATLGPTVGPDCSGAGGAIGSFNYSLSE